MTAPVLLAAATAFVLGARHGLDWDHLAAIADLAGSSGRSRHSLVLALSYCLGHGLVIVLLGVLVGLVGVRLPHELDLGFEGIVGLTLIGLGALVLGQIVREGRGYRLRSRWTLALRLVQSHWQRFNRHQKPERDRGADALSGKLAFGVGILHGTGAETPTQVVLFASTAAAGSASGALLVLGAFVLGLVVSDVAVALVWLSGRLGPVGGQLGQLALGIATGVASIAVGSAFIVQSSPFLPGLFG